MNREAKLDNKSSDKLKITKNAYIIRHMSLLMNKQT